MPYLQWVFLHTRQPLSIRKYFKKHVPVWWGPAQIVCLSTAHIYLNRGKSATRCETGPIPLEAKKSMCKQTDWYRAKGFWNIQLGSPFPPYRSLLAPWVSLWSLPALVPIQSCTQCSGCPGEGGISQIYRTLIFGISVLKYMPFFFFYQKRIKKAKHWKNCNILLCGAAHMSY